MLLQYFINGNSTPLRNLLKSKIISSTIFQTISEESISKSEEIIQQLTEQFNSDYNVQYLHLNLNQIILTLILFTIASYHNYNILYNKTKYISSLTQNVKIIITIVLLILTKNIDSVY